MRCSAHRITPYKLNMGGAVAMLESLDLTNDRVSGNSHMLILCQGRRSQSCAR